jgi:ubiquinone/menaquinone biosynthesis C-methylase UbiE
LYDWGITLKPERGIRRPVHDYERTRWESAEAVLSGIGLKPGFTFVDIGCGRGFYALPAARIVGKEGRVYGLDIDAESIAAVKEEAAAAGLENLYLTVGRAEETILCRRCADIIFIATALHDFQDPSRVLKNARTMIKPTGRLVDLDWKKEPADFGPPLRIRLSTEQAVDLIEAAGFTVETTGDSGPHHYLVIAKPGP